MGLNDDLSKYVKGVFQGQWTRRDGQVVPTYDQIKLEGNDGVELDGTVLYADLAESTELVRTQSSIFAAEVYKNYLYCAAKLIADCGGVVTAYDGDRVMGVFIGDSKNTSAVDCALKINYAVFNILRPAIKAQYPNSGFELKQKVGVDTSKLLFARTGVRGTNDLVWVGSASNNAAKLAALPTRYYTYISESVYTNMHSKAKMGGTPPQDMWTSVSVPALGFKVYGSTWKRTF